MKRDSDAVKPISASNYSVDGDTGSSYTTVVRIEDGYKFYIAATVERNHRTKEEWLWNIRHIDGDNHIEIKEIDFENLMQFVSEHPEIMHEDRSAMGKYKEQMNRRWFDLHRQEAADPAIA